jgi:hypothetical protein
VEDVEMGKYAPLKAFLMEQGEDQVPMTFAEIEKVLGLQLPPSKQYPAWWSNNPSNNTMTREWLDAGYETESVDTASGKLVFRRLKKPDTFQPATASTSKGKEGAASRHPAFGFMKGLLIVEDGYDVTKPMDETWEDGYLGVDDKR